MKDKIGSYEIIKEISRTAVEIVFRARDIRTDKNVYLREIILPSDIKTLLLKELIPELQEWGKKVKNLQHPNILCVREEIKLGDRYFIVTEHAEGKPLRVILDQKLPLSLPQATNWIKQLTSALDFLHQKGIVLGKLYQEDILLDDRGNLRIINPGLSLIMADIKEEKLVYPVAPVNYYAPEVVTGLRKAETGSDIFTLGILFYEMVTGQRPFEDKSRDLIISRIITEEPLSPRVFNPRISREIELVILKALEKNVDQRYQTAGEILSDLQKIIEGQKYEATPEEQVAIARKAKRVIRRDRFHREAARFLQKKRSWVIAFAVILIGGCLFYFLGRPSPVPQYVTELTTPLEVVQLYYQGLQELDITILDQITVEKASRQAIQMIAFLRVSKAYTGEPMNYELKNLQITALPSSPEEPHFQATYLQSRLVKETEGTREEWYETSDILQLKLVKNKWAIYSVETTSPESDN